MLMIERACFAYVDGGQGTDSSLFHSYSWNIWTKTDIAKPLNNIISCVYKNFSTYFLKWYFHPLRSPCDSTNYFHNSKVQDISLIRSSHYPGHFGLVPRVSLTIRMYWSYNLYLAITTHITCTTTRSLPQSVAWMNFVTVHFYFSSIH